MNIRNCGILQNNENKGNIKIRINNIRTYTYIYNYMYLQNCFNFVRFWFVDKVECADGNCRERYT